MNSRALEPATLQRLSYPPKSRHAIRQIAKARAATTYRQASALLRYRCPSDILPSVSQNYAATVSFDFPLACNLYLAMRHSRPRFVLNAGNRLLRFRGRQLAFPGVNGDVTYVRRRAIAAGILACHENAEKVITPLQVVESFVFFW